MTEPQFGGTYEEILAFARHAQDRGLVSFARSDHLAWQGAVRDATDAFATLAGLARDTEEIRLCVLVSPITFRHPAIIAKNAATIDQMSGGRLDLGVGTGWNPYEHEVLGLHFPDPKERWARLQDALGYLRSAFADPSPPHEGDHYELHGDVRPKPRGIRLVMGGSGPMRTPATAGRLADEYNSTATEHDAVAARIKVMRDSAGDRDVEATVMVHIDAKSVDSLVERVDAYEEAGVERIYLQWFDLTDFRGMARALDKVLSR